MVTINPGIKNIVSNLRSTLFNDVYVFSNQSSSSLYYGVWAEVDHDLDIIKELYIPLLMHFDSPIPTKEMENIETVSLTNIRNKILDEIWDVKRSLNVKIENNISNVIIYMNITNNIRLDVNDIIRNNIVNNIRSHIAIQENLKK